MKQNKPLLIVLTPVYNEAWILRAFLKATSLWADYIIIADQMSDDGSRELYEKFNVLTNEGVNEHKCKLIVIDNPRKEMHQAATRRLLFEEAKKIKGDKILFTLDADEFLSGDFMETEGWKTIMNSEQGDVFEFRWMNLSEEGSLYTPFIPYYWAAHIDDELLNGEFPDNFIHEWRLPWPKHVNHEYTIEDICFIHFARVNAARQRNKERFYQVSQSSTLNWYSGIGFYRMYRSENAEKMHVVPEDTYAFYEKNNIDIISLLDLNDEGMHYTSVVLNKFRENGTRFYKKLDIWDEKFIQKYGITDPRSWLDKLMHKYLRGTNKWKKTFLIRAIDKVLKMVY